MGNRSKCCNQNKPTNPQLSIKKTSVNDVIKPIMGMVIALSALGTTAYADYFDDLRTNQQTSNPLVEWQNIGPGMSGYIDMFWIHKADDNAMFMDLDMGNAHGTWDGGTQWKSIKNPDDTGSVMTGITGVEFSQQTPNFGLMLAKEGIFSTNDRGRSWQFLLDIDTSNSQKHNTITVDPTDDNNWYIGAGQQWQIKHTHFNKDGLFYSSSRNHSKGFILKSTDKGQSWTKVTTGLPNDTDVSKIVVSPKNPLKVFASTQHGVYRSTDAGSTWTKLTGLGNHVPRDMTYHYDATSNQFYLYIVAVTQYSMNGTTIEASGGVFRSGDHGNTWKDLTGNLAIDLTKINSWGYHNRYYDAMAKWFKTDKSVIQALDVPDNTMSQFIGIEVDPDDQNRVYLVHNYKHDYAFPPGNIWMTDNANAGENANWYAAAREGQYWINMATDPDLTEDKAYWQSRNQPFGMNATFAHVQREHEETDNTTSGPRFLEINNNGDVFTAFAQQVMRSTDNGATWNQIDDVETSSGSGHWVGSGDSNLPGESLNVHTGTQGQVLFGSGEHGLWRNTTDGELVYPGAIAVEQLTGQSIADDSPLSISSIAVHPNNSDKIYTLQFRQTQRGALRYSQDGGQSWVTRSTPVDFPAANDVIKQHSLIIDPSNPNHMYFTVPISIWAAFGSNKYIANGPDTFTGYGVYKSVDNGLTWKGLPQINAGLEGKSIHHLALDPTSPNILYAASNVTHDQQPGGLFKTTNRGWAWSPVNLPAGVKSVNNVRVTDNGDIYIAVGTYTNDSSTGGAFKSTDDGNNWTQIFDMEFVKDVIPSPVNNDVIMVNVGQSKAYSSLNPGAYATTDGGMTWDKVNGDFGQQSRIREIEADPYDVQTFWASTNGTGFFKIDLNPLLIQAPDRIQAEHYHRYSDTGATNQGGQYRNDGVDIQKTSDTGGGYNLSWTADGEWIEFDINIQQAGNYTIDTRVASPNANGKFKYQLNGNKIGKDTLVPATGGWQNWQTISLNVGALPAGSHKLRLRFIKGGFNVNWFELKNN